MDMDIMETQVFRARLIVAAYIVFSIAVILFDLWSHTQKELHEWLLPMTGWTGLFLYRWTLMFAFFALIFTDRTPVMILVQMLKTVTVIEFLTTTFHAIIAGFSSPSPENPYLMYDPVRPLITVLPPILWTTVFWNVGRNFVAADESRQGAGPVSAG